MATPLIRTLSQVPREASLEGFHCRHLATFIVYTHNSCMDTGILLQVPELKYQLLITCISIASYTLDITITLAITSTIIMSLVSRKYTIIVDSEDL